MSRLLFGLIIYVVLGLCATGAGAADRIAVIAAKSSGPALSENGSHAFLPALKQPNGVAALPDGSIIIVNTGRHCLLKRTPHGGFDVIAGKTQASPILGPNENFSPTQLSYPKGVTSLADGSIIVADTINNRVLRVRTDGKLIPLAGMLGWRGTATIDPNGDPLKSELWLPHGVAAHADGWIVITDTFNHRVLRLGTNGKLVQIAGTGKRGSNLSSTGDPLESQLDAPAQVAIHPDGSIVFADASNNRILKLGHDEKLIPIAGTGSKGAAIDPDGNPLASQLDCPTGVAIQQDGSIIIADTDNNRVLKLGTDGKLIPIAGGAKGSVLDPQGDPLKSQLHHPTMLAICSDGSILISDSDNHRVLSVMPEHLANRWTVRNKLLRQLPDCDERFEAVVALDHYADQTATTANNISSLTKKAEAGGNDSTVRFFADLESHLENNMSEGETVSQFLDYVLYVEKSLKFSHQFAPLKLRDKLSRFVSRLTWPEDLEFNSATTWESEREKTRFRDYINQLFPEQSDDEDAIQLQNLFKHHYRDINNLPQDSPVTNRQLCLHVLNTFSARLAVHRRAMRARKALQLLQPTLDQPN